MIVYELIRNRKEFRYVVGVDPGYRTGAVVVLDKYENTLLFFSNNFKGPPVMGVPFPEVYNSIDKSVDWFVESIGTPFDDTNVVIEYSYFGGEFSEGINIFLSIFLTKVRSKGVGGIVLVPPNLGIWFRKKRTSDKKAVVDMLKTAFPAYSSQIKSNHRADALLNTVLVEYEYYKRNFGIYFRQPDYKTIYLGQKYGS